MSRGLGSWPGFATPSQPRPQHVPAMHHSAWSQQQPRAWSGGFRRFRRFWAETCGPRFFWALHPCDGFIPKEKNIRRRENKKTPTWGNHERVPFMQIPSQGSARKLRQFGTSGSCPQIGAQCTHQCFCFSVFVSVFVHQFLFFSLFSIFLFVWSALWGCLFLFVCLFL